jgi:tetraacyldisaccharide 4'-kinase
VIVDAWLQRVWYERSAWALLLLPLALIFWFVSSLRRVAYRVGLLRAIAVGVPVIVVGNLTVGGTGKTPLVIWLAKQLKERGYKPGIITRGYGGKADRWPQPVTSSSDPTMVGDEAVHLAQRTERPVVAGPDRVAASQALVSQGANVIISDDGLQHYRLARQFEIAVIDGERAFGNRLLLPAGPLREPVSRLKRVGMVAVTERGTNSLRRLDLARWHPVFVRSAIAKAVSLATGQMCDLAVFSGKSVHVVAGIGNPSAFFNALSALGVDVIPHALPDHAVITPDMIRFNDDHPVLMTEKDAVKCRHFASDRCFSVPLEVELEGAQRLMDAIDRAIGHSATAA